jgi:GNAT superfamily N-acetyltransferase
MVHAQLSEMRFSIRKAEMADRDVVAQLVREMMPGCDAERRLTWLYEGNPAGHALTWLADADGEIAGCTSFFPFRLQLDGAQALAALGGDGWVRPEFRRHGIGAALHEASRSALGGDGLACMYGAPGSMNLSPLKHGGSREVCTVSRWIRPLRGVGALLTWLERATGAIRWPRARLVPMLQRDSRVDAVWQAARTELAIGAVRDSAFYTWRFLDSPASREPAYVIVRGKRPIAACALDAMAFGRNLRIVDLIAVPGAWHDALGAIAAFASTTTSATTLDIKLASPDGRRRQMWRSGFFEREHKPFLVMLPQDGDRRLVDPARWFYSGADSDLDAAD